MVDHCPYGSEPKPGADVEAGILTMGNLRIRAASSGTPVTLVPGGVLVDRIALARELTNTNRNISTTVIWFEDILSFCQKPPPTPEQINYSEDLPQISAYAAGILAQRWIENCQCGLNNSRDTECSYWAKKGQCEGSFYAIYTDLDLRVYSIDDEGNIPFDRILRFTYVSFAYGPLGIPFFIDDDNPNFNRKFLAIKSQQGTEHEETTIITYDSFYVPTGTENTEDIPLGTNQFAVRKVFIGSSSYCLVQGDDPDNCCARPSTPEYPTRDSSGDQIIEIEEEDVTVIFIPVEGPPGPPGPQGPKGDPGNPTSIVTNFARVDSETPESFTATSNFYGDTVTIDLKLHNQPQVRAINMALQRVPADESARVTKGVTDEEINFTLFLPYPPTVQTALSFFTDPDDDPNFTAATEEGITTIRLKLYREMLRPIVEEIRDLLKGQETIAMKITDCEGNELSQNVTAPRIVAIAKAIGIAQNLSDTRDQRTCTLTEQEVIEMRTTNCEGNPLSQNVSAPRLVAIAKAVGFAQNLSDTRDQRMCNPVPSDVDLTEVVSKLDNISQALIEPETIEMRTTDCNGSQLSQNVVAPRIVAIAKAVGISQNLSDSRDQRMCAAPEIDLTEVVNKLTTIENKVDDRPTRLDIAGMLFLQSTVELALNGAMLVVLAQVQIRALAVSTLTILEAIIGSRLTDIVTDIIPNLPSITLFDRLIDISGTIEKLLEINLNVPDADGQAPDIDLSEVIKKLDNLNELLSEQETIEMKTTDCENNQVSQNVTAPRIKAIAKSIGISQNLSDERDKRMCKEPIAAIPDWWQTRPGADRPQLVIQFAEYTNDSRLPPKYVISIPHYSGNVLNSSPITAYTKGDWMGIATLDDNSKIIVNCYSQAEASRVLTQALAIVPNYLKTKLTTKIGQRNGDNLQSVRVVPRIAKFFSTGQRNTKPDWVKYFD